jgi:hypothetical protein
MGVVFLAEAAFPAIAAVFEAGALAEKSTG